VLFRSHPRDHAPRTTKSCLQAKEPTCRQPPQWLSSRVPSSGIGRAAALALVNAGFAVVGAAHRADVLDLDVASDESVRALIDKVIERFGRIDILVNNAGVGAVGAGEESSINETREVFNTNVFGLMRMTNAALPHCAPGATAA